MSPLKVPYNPHLNIPYTTPILEIVKESPKVKSFIIDYHPLADPVKIFPGQFVMVWIPGVDEIPMSVSRIGPDHKLRISVAKVGDATHALHQLQVGDLIGIRGPYGTSYNLHSGITLIVGGGFGMASIIPLINEYIAHPPSPESHIVIIEGARTKSELLFEKEIKSILGKKEKVYFCTDDGSYEFKGYVTEKISEILKIELDQMKKLAKQQPITIFACGPEKMLVQVVAICEKNKIPAQISLERMMRCGFGICGLCALEPDGLLVCRDGPIFSLNEIRKVSDFGKYLRDMTGKTYSI